MANVDDRLVARFGLLSIQLDRVRAVHAIAEQALGLHDSKIDEWYEDNLKRDPDDGEFIAYLRRVQKEDVTDGYPLVFRSALFATAYGALEYCMNSVCRYLEPKIAGIGLDDVRGEGIQRAHLYLTKVAKANLDATPEWDLVLLYGKLRNALVHAQGDLAHSRSLTAIQNLAGRVKTFSVVEAENRVVLGPSFTPTFVDTAEAFADQMDGALAHHIFAS